MKQSKRFIEASKMVDMTKAYEPEDAIKLVVDTATAKFDESVELHVKLGVDSRHADQQVRGVVVLPHGTGKVKKVLVIAKGVLVGRIGKILGPKGLMPNPKSGTVTMDVTKAVNEIKAGKVEYRLDKTNIIHVAIGKKSFGAEKLMDNYNTIYDAIVKAKPAAAKGQYIKSVSVSSTMGPGIKIAAKM